MDGPILRQRQYLQTILDGWMVAWRSALRTSWNIRFLAFFVNAGVKLREIRGIMDAVRTELNRAHPFATNTVFKTDGKKIVAEITSRHGHSAA